MTGKEIRPTKYRATPVDRPLERAEAIRRQIERAVEEEEAERRVEARIRAWLEKHDPEHVEERVTPLWDQVRGYVAISTHPLEVLATLADGPQGPFAVSLLQVMVGYFEDEHDLLDDSQGLFGLLDDAYLCLRTYEHLMKGWARKEPRAAEPLAVLSARNDFVERLFRPAIREALDKLVYETLREAQNERAMAGLQETPGDRTKEMVTRTGQTLTDADRRWSGDTGLDQTDIIDMVASSGMF